jgi:hypothetical protein
MPRNEHQGHRKCVAAYGAHCSSYAYPDLTIVVSLRSGRVETLPYRCAAPAALKKAIGKDSPRSEGAKVST